MPPGKTQDVLCFFLFLFVLLQNTFNIDVFVLKLVKIVIFYLLFCCFCRIWSTKCPQTENKKEQKNHAAGKIARCPLSFLLLDPPPPPLKHETSYYPILILNVISRAVNSKSLLHVIFGDFVKFHCLIQALFFSL